MSRRSLALVLVVAGCPGDDATGEGETGGDVSSTGLATSESSSDVDTGSLSTSIDPDDSGESTVGSSCGDGVREGVEVCDDANTRDGDGCSADCATADCLVPITHPTIQTAVDDAACPTVRLAGGEYHEFVGIARDVQIVASGPLVPIVDAQGLGRPFDVAAGVVVGMQGLEIAGGSAHEGGAILSHGALTLVDVVVRDSRVEGELPCGGAVWSDGALTIVGGAITGNESVLVRDTGTASGGGLCIVGGTLQLDAATISGNVARATGPGSVAAEGAGVFAADADVVMTRGTTLAENRVEITAAVGNAIGSGAAVRQQGGTLTAAGVVVADNVVLVDGAAAPGATLVAEGGGVALSAVATTTDGIAITGNRAEASGTGELVARGGGLRVSGLTTTELVLAEIRGNEAIASGDVALAHGGGAWITLGSGAPGQSLALTLVDTSVSDNAATASGGESLARGAGLDALVTGDGRIAMRLDHSAVTADVASASTSAGGGLALSAAASGGRIDLAVVDSTLSGAVAVRGGGIAAEAATDAVVAIALRSATVTACTADEGAGLWLASGVSVDMAASILAGNSGGSDCEPAEATVISLGHDAIASSSCAVVPDATDVLGDVVLEPLADNGGPTPTHALPPDSPLRNAGDPAGCVDEQGAALATDQRHEDRHAEGFCDIGAFELVP